MLGADEGFSHWQSDLQENVRPADVGWHWHRYLSSGLNWNGSGTNSADGETSLVGSVASTVALVELQEEEVEEEPVRRQMSVVVLMLVVKERGKKNAVVARNMQEVGDADADAGQS
ncbi:unnamed protein product [Fusarium graminearum]|uniref:Chromosome 2, complete genome n=2 Tax=Gibberella zeae TaxID=5518 RepID=A0A098DEJ8_GIBZE|nr:unnamed protein product [Fusarium graminearum]CAF3642315.1 unnamed protein product [Fusarium graminearum]CAF3665273.1 unnamed protein product [Fusarium graminearum]CAG1960031.1 unnamed protein product [Fusarium graminearum]CAG1963356.1 unnamed protein product [Fusarium graminearum]